MHIDLMVVTVADRLTAVCLECTEPDIVAWLRAKGHEIIYMPFRDTIGLEKDEISKTGGGIHRMAQALRRVA